MRLLRLLVLSSSFLITLAAGAIEPAATLSPTQKLYWQKILHTHRGSSRADGPLFFLSPQGKHDPEAELKATLLAFKNPDAKAGWFGYHPQCVFRERLRFLKSVGLLEGVSELPCLPFFEWKAGLNADSATLIFSSSYPNNPSSLFGHTLLRLNQKNKKNDLLDYAVAFSAVPESEDLGIIFAFKGMFGGYKGLFEITKYYTKVNEYSSGESRDLIEYHLRMTPDELERLTNHLWELYQTTYFDYFFADENCSTVLSDLLAVAFQDSEQVSARDRWYYLPAEMVKHMTSADKVESVVYRPSLKKQVEKIWAHLSDQEAKEVQSIVKKGEIPPGFSQEKILDALISYLNFTHYRTKNNLSSQEKKLLRQALIVRSGLAKGEEVKETYAEDNRPERGHEPQKFSSFFRLENHTSLLGFELKQGYHDLMGRDEGFDAFSQFDFLTFSLLYDIKNKKLSYDQVVLVDLASLHSYTYYDPQFAWKARVSSERVYDLECSLCHKVNAQAGGGVALKFSRSVLSLMGGLFLEASPHLNKGFRVGPLIDVAFYSQWGGHYKLGLFSELRFDATKKMSEDFYNRAGLRHSFFADEKRDYRLESQVVSRFGRFKKNTLLHQVTYGHYF